MIATLTKLTAVTLLSVSSASAQACSWAPDGAGVTYDMTKLQQAGPYFTEGGDLDCTWDVVEQNYTYFFQFCGNVDKSPAQSCDGHDGAVLQLDYRASFDNQCKSAGKSSSTPKYGYADPSDPASGFRVTYTGGDHCNTNNVDRQTTVVAYCDEAGLANDGANQVREIGGAKACNYEIVYHSSFACPKECPVTGDERKACGGNGYCRYDHDALKARCFCNTGFGGPDCTTDLNSGVDGTIVGLLVTVFIVTLMLGIALAVVYRQVRRFRDEGDSYMKLRGQELVTNDSI
jgi:hypothetical protein